MKDVVAKLACTPLDHPDRERLSLSVNEASLERCSRIFRALGDTARLRLIARLAQDPACVGELAELEGESITTISQRLRVLRADNIVRGKRDGKHVLYSLADQHMLDLVFNGLAHASEPAVPHPSTHSLFQQQKGNTMPTEHITHANHTHEHDDACGHTAIQHNDHVDFLHDGHLHHPHNGHVDEHKLEVTASNPDTCTDGHKCNGHDAQHTHGPNCGHEAVPHGDHVDYLVEGHLHNAHNGHCDNHGPVQVVQ